MTRAAKWPSRGVSSWTTTWRPISSAPAAVAALAAAAAGADEIGLQVVVQDETPRLGHFAALVIALDAEHVSYLPLAHEQEPALSRTARSEEHTSELQSRSDLVCRLLLEKKKKKIFHHFIHKKTKKQPY